MQAADQRVARRKALVHILQPRLECVRFLLLGGKVTQIDQQRHRLIIDTDIHSYPGSTSSSVSYAQLLYNRSAKRVQQRVTRDRVAMPAIW